jgi:hypothetical protein
MLLRSNGRNGKSHKSKYTDEPDQLEHEEPPCSTNRTHVQLIRGLSPYRDCCIQTINQREGRLGLGSNRRNAPLLHACGTVISMFAPLRGEAHRRSCFRHPGRLLNEPAAEAIRTRNEHRSSERRCRGSCKGPRGHGELRCPGRRSPRNMQFRRNRRNAW